MPTLSFSDRIKGLALDLTWSQWAELGVSGWTRHHDQVVLDLEPLIIATSGLGHMDARLLAESLDWCVLNSRFVSAYRLRNLLPTFGEATRAAFGRYAATVRKHRRASWPGEGDPLRFSPTGRSSVPDMGRRALLQLRLRAIFGVSARAEIIKRMLSEPDRPFGIAELTMYTAYGKDNLADALDMMSIGGLISRNVMTAGGTVGVFTFPTADNVNRLLGGILAPDRHPYWAARFRLVMHLVDFATSAPADRVVRAAEIERLLGSMHSDLWWVAPYPRIRRGVDAVNDDFEEWSTKLLSKWANAEHEAERN